MSFGYSQQIYNCASQDVHRSVINSVKEKLKNREYHCITIAQEESDLHEIKEICKELLSKFKKFVVLGMGGSSLGGRTLCALSDNKNVMFLDSMDPHTMHESITTFTDDTCFIVISKSGETIETIVQTLVILDIYKNKSDIGSSFLFITQNKPSTLKNIAGGINAKVLEHPSDIGGRYSYISLVGLIPACLCGLDVDKIRNGAKRILNAFVSSESSIVDDAILAQVNCMNHEKIAASVMMPYIDRLHDFTEWYRQLWSESLGKNGMGTIPINSVGTRDQHSQLQLYLDGPRNKFFTIISPADQNLLVSFGGKDFKVSDIMCMEYQLTLDDLKNKNLPIRSINIEAFNEETVSSIMMQMELETIAIGSIRDLNPFDQPAVDARKKSIQTMLKA